MLEQPFTTGSLTRTVRGAVKGAVRRARRSAASGAMFGALILRGAPVGAQTLVASPDTVHSVRVGDSVTVRLRAELGRGAELVDRVPRLADTLPEGTRLLSADSLTRRQSAAGGVSTFVGAVYLVFLRTGVRPIPPFVVAYRAGPGSRVDTIRSAPLHVAIASVLSSPDEAIKDIKDLERVRRGGRVRSGVLAAIALLAALAWLAGRRVRRRPAPPVETPPPGPYERALEWLDEIERAGVPAPGDLVGHYQAVGDVLRRYLAEAYGLPAIERTTPELARMLPPPLGEGAARVQCLELLGEADLVKFARVRPGADTAATFAQRGRELLGRWHEALPHTPGIAVAGGAVAGGGADAVR